MISLNGIQIDEAELKRQLEAQGYEVSKKPEPKWKVGDLFWDQYRIGHTSCDGLVISYSETGRRMSDELIREYEKLHKLADGVVVGGRNPYEDKEFFDTVEKIAALKGRKVE